jgi:catechol 2,3-dioxygenase-like lactoylglutathione lyase family enzyme
MPIPPRASVVALRTADLARSTAFYVALGWDLSPAPTAAMSPVQDGRGSCRWKQAELTGLGDRLGPAVDLELAVDGLDLAADGGDRDRQLAADVPGRQPGGQQPQDHQLPLRQRCGHLHSPAGPRAKRFLDLLQH